MLDQPACGARQASGSSLGGIVWTVLVAALLVQRPVSAPDYWWHLARGRAVVAGTLAPSRQLLTLDRAAEADWLGGVPFYLLWAQGGVFAVAVVPLAMIACLLWFVRRRTDTVSWLATMVGLPLWLWVIRDSLQPTPALFDAWSLVAVGTVLQSPQCASRRLLWIGLAFCVWANLSAQPLWGLLLLTLCAPPAESRARLAMAALLGGMLTPRGLLTWRDALLSFAPRAFAGAAEIVDPRWPGMLTDGAGTSSTVAFLLLWGGWASLRLPSGRDANTIARLAVPLLAAMTSRQHLPMCGIWLLLDWLASLPLTSPLPIRLPWRPKIVVAAGALLSMAIVIDATGNGLDQSRFGVGVAQELDVRLLDVAALAVDESHAIAWAADARSAGVAAWIGGRIRLVDHPQRALLGRRWPLHEALIRDLLGAHRAAYRRDDGEWGGFVPRLAEWNASLLFVPAEDVPLNRALSGTTWRPVDLDSPTVPYVSTDDDFFARPILEVMQQEGFVEAGPWQPTTDNYAGRGWRYDGVEWMGFGPDPIPAIRQSQFFRFRDLPMASLRALLPVRRQASSRWLSNEFRRCQEKLAYQEWVRFGETSQFRRQAVLAIANDRHPTNLSPWLQPEGRQPPEDVDQWTASLQHYLSGRMQEAVEALPLETDEGRYAAAMLWLESGESRRAIDEVRRLTSKASATHLQAAAVDWIGQIAPFEPH